MGVEGVVEGGEDNLAERGGGMGRVSGEGQGKGIDACSRRSR